MLRLIAGFVAGVAATFVFFLSGYGERVSEWAKKAEVIAEEIQTLEKETQGARELARSLSKSMISQKEKQKEESQHKSDQKN
jgi:glycerol dehydrogenase-like iron-containing ADH family enzyme